MTNPSSSLGSFYALDPVVVTYLKSDGGALLYHPDTREERYINSTGLFLWRALDGRQDVIELARILAAACGIPLSDKVRRDTSRFLKDLERRGFAGSSGDPSAGTAPGVTWVRDGDAPRSIDISLTGRCNLACQYCFYADDMLRRPDLPGDEWKHFFAELGELGVRRATLSGGELFLREDLWDLIDALISNRLRYSMLSNGTLIDAQTIDAFAQGLRFSRLDSIQISVDGSSPDVHDRSRGPGSFNRAVRGLRLLHGKGFPVTCRVTINRFNIGDLENIALFLLEDIGIDGMTTNDAVPMGAGCRNSADIGLTPAQRVEAMLTLRRLSDKYGERVSATAGPQAQDRMFREMRHARATGRNTDRWTMGRLAGCGCIFSKLAVHHDGTIVPCNLLASLELGRINRDSLRSLWLSHPTLRALRERRSIPMNRVPGCETCEWTPFCNGGCPGLAQELTGDCNRANPHDCYRQFLGQTDAAGCQSLVEIP